MSPHSHPMALCPPPSTATLTDGKEGPQSFHFQQKKVASSSSSSYRSGNYSAEQASANAAEMKRVQAGDVTYEENSHAAALKEKVEMDGVTAEKKAATLQEQRSGNPPLLLASYDFSKSRARKESHIPVPSFLGNLETKGTKSFSILLAKSWELM